MESKAESKYSPRSDNNDEINSDSYSAIDLKAIENDTCRISRELLITQAPEKTIYGNMDYQLTDEQKYIFYLIEEGKNIFITGPSGSGKSLLIQKIVAKLRGLGEKVAVTSANIQGAINIGGKTIHSFSGLKKLDEDLKTIEANVNTPYIQNIWCNISVIIIDDISMLKPNELKNILYIAKYSRLACNKKRPLMWILLGDFLSRANSLFKYNAASEKKEDEFCFEMPEWKNFQTAMLTFNYRQDEKTEKDFVEILEDLRKGGSNYISWASRFKKQSDNNNSQKKGPVTRFLSVNEMIGVENDKKFKELKTPIVSYYAQKGYQIGNTVYPSTLSQTSENISREITEMLEKNSISDYNRTQILKFLEQNCPVEAHLKLKKGAVVILMANLDITYGLVKGSQGIVIGFTDHPHYYPVVQFKQCECVVPCYMWTMDYSNDTKLWHSQIPLKLGWYYNIHRLRGMTFDQNVIIDMKIVNEYGQFYEVLSKVNSMDNVYIDNTNWNAMKVHEKCVNYYEQVSKQWMDEYQSWCKKGLKKMNSEAVVAPSTNVLLKSAMDGKTLAQWREESKEKTSNTTSNNTSNFNSTSNSNNSSSNNSSTTNKSSSLKRKTETNIIQLDATKQAKMLLNHLNDNDDEMIDEMIDEQQDEQQDEEYSSNSSNNSNNLDEDQEEEDDEELEE